LADPRQPCRKSGEPPWPRNRIIFQPRADPTAHAAFRILHQSQNGYLHE
jgi:hypothetical protein